MSPEEIAKEVEEVNLQINELKNEITKLERSLSDAKSVTLKVFSVNKYFVKLSRRYRTLYQPSLSPSQDMRDYMIRSSRKP